MNASHPDYQPTINIWLTCATVMPTVQTPKDRTTAAASRAIWEMETIVMVKSQWHHLFTFVYLIFWSYCCPGLKGFLHGFMKKFKGNWKATNVFRFSLILL